jgi:hypothetical protein
MDMPGVRRHQRARRRAALASCAKDSLAIWGESFEDFVGGFGPGERPRVVVPGADVFLESLEETVRSTPALLVGQQREPTLDLVEPG